MDVLLSVVVSTDLSSCFHCGIWLNSAVLAFICSICDKDVWLIENGNQTDECLHQQWSCVLTSKGSPEERLSSIILVSLFHVNNEVRGEQNHTQQQQYRAVKTQLVRQMFMKATSKAGDVLSFNRMFCECMTAVSCVHLDIVNIVITLCLSFG